MILNRIVSVCTSRGGPKRNTKGEAIFYCEYDNGTYGWLPFRSLVIPDVAIHQDMVSILRLWNNTAKEFPNHKRLCLISGKRTVPGTLFRRCHQKWFQVFVDLWTV